MAVNLKITSIFLHIQEKKVKLTLLLLWELIN